MPRPDQKTDADLKAEFIATRGITLCPIGPRLDDVAEIVRLEFETLRREAASKRITPAEIPA